MADKLSKNIRFALPMNGSLPRTLQELIEKFSAYEILLNFRTGKLRAWLEDRYYDDACNKIRECEDKYSREWENPNIPAKNVVEEIYKILVEERRKESSNKSIDSIIELPENIKLTADSLGNLSNVETRIKKNQDKRNSSRMDFGKNTQGSAKDVEERLSEYMDAGLPLIYLNTFEEDKADELITRVARRRTIFEWNAEGFFEKGSDGGFVRYQLGWDFLGTLNYLIDDVMPAYLGTENETKKKYVLHRSILVLKDVHSLLENDDIIARVKHLAQLIYKGNIEDCNIIIISPDAFQIPKELEKYVTIVRLNNPSTDEIEKLIHDFYNSQIKNINKRVMRGIEASLEDELVKKLVGDLKGLSEFDIINILSLAFSDDGEIDSSDLPLIRDQKKQMIQKTDVLEMIDTTESEAEIGGLEILKQWLKNKAYIFQKLETAKNYGVDVPKGVMIAGMPGCGKSLTAKVAANEFKAPLLRMDMGRIMGKYVGESEANMRKALHLAEVVSPCILWIDEIEKSFAGIHGDGGGAEIATRLFGTFLTWMQEKKTPVFVVATANKVNKLPPELLRRGRFDEVFYVGVPNLEDRKKNI